MTTPVSNNRNVFGPGQGPAAAEQNTADKFLAEAMKYLGQPYLWGGGHTGATQNGPAPVDCSGLVLQAARKAGINLDGTAAMQQDKGHAVSMNDLKPGDLVFKGNPAYHVGIYIGNGQVLHAPKTGDVVRVTSVSGWDSARRIFDEGGQPIDTAGLPTPPAGTGTGTGGGGDSAGVGGGGRSSGLGLGGSDLDEMRRKIQQTYQQAGRDGGQAGGPNPAAAAHSGLQNVNTKDVPANMEGLMGKLEQAGVSKEFLSEMAEKYGVPLEMILAVIQQESGGNPNAQSPVGAQGLMQLMPDTARGLGVQNAMDPKQNVEGGVKYLAQMLRQFDNDTTKALAAYNAGPGNVQKYGGVPPFSETQNYVRNITAMMEQNRGLA